MTCSSVATHMLIRQHMHRPAVSSLFKSAFEWTCSLGTVRTRLHVVSHNLSLFCGERHGVLFFMALSQAGMSHYKALLMSRLGTGNKSLLDLQTWITALNQFIRHCVRTSELRQLVPTPQLLWFPACSSQPVYARFPEDLYSGVKNKRGELQL